MSDVLAELVSAHEKVKKLLASPDGWSLPWSAQEFSSVDEAELIVLGVNLLPVVRDILADAISTAPDHGGVVWAWIARHQGALRLARAINGGER